MDIQARLNLSYYKEIAVIREDHHIYVVQHLQTGKIFLKKELTVYNAAIYQQLQRNPIPNTPRIYEVFEEDHRLTVVEEYISGNTLEEWMESGRSFSPDEIRRIAVQLCGILSDLHHCTPAIIHRDIKPSNIILTPSGQIFLLDFNAAKYYSDEKEKDTTLLGTEGYAAPEQYGFGISTPQTDIYALGILINTLVNGTYAKDIVKHSEFDSIIRKCTRMEAFQRFKDADTILVLLQGRKPFPDRSELVSRMSWLPPGYRSRSPVNMLLATAVYLTVFWLCATVQIENTTPVTLFLNRLFLLLIFLSTILCTCNYRNVQMYFPPCRTQNKLLRVLSILLLDALVAISLLFILALLISWFA